MATTTAKKALSKADIDRFFLGKRIIACGVCGRFQSPCDVDVHSLNCQRVSCADNSSEPVSVLMMVCRNCGAIQFHDRGVIADWLENHSAVPVE